MTGFFDNAPEVPEWITKFKVSVPDGASGEWRVERFTITPQQSSFTRLRALIGDGGGRGYLPPGDYTALYRGQTLVMSDTPDEIADHVEPIKFAFGRVLINGLGLGMVAKAMLDRPEVVHVTVVELSADVIALVGPSLKAYTDAGRLTIVHADAYAYTPPAGTRFAVVWNDIWDTISSANLEGMTRLHRKYGRRSMWIGSWARKACERMRRVERDCAAGRGDPFRPMPLATGAINPAAWKKGQEWRRRLDREAQRHLARMKKLEAEGKVKLVDGVYQVVADDDKAR